jgi:threonine dehydratase
MNSALQQAPSLAEITAARDRLRPYLPVTPLEEALALGPDVWLKLECANKTHSFKGRGALNAMLLLPESVRARGVVAASSGNHAQGVAYAARLLNVPARIVMSEHAARRKVANVRRLGAEAILVAGGYEEAEAEARRLERTLGLAFVSPYNDPHVIAGAGTVGLEILEALPDIERIVVCVGGGGLISGIALAAKAARPEIEIIGVNVEAAPAMYDLYYGRPHTPETDTLADALPGGIEAGSITIAITRQYVDRMVLVSEADVRRAMRYLAFEQGWIAEGGGCVALAAVMAGRVPDGRRTAVTISGGNVDAHVLLDVLHEGA